MNRLLTWLRGLGRRPEPTPAPATVPVVRAPRVRIPRSTPRRATLRRSHRWSGAVARRGRTT